MKYLKYIFTPLKVVGVFLFYITYEIWDCVELLCLATYFAFFLGILSIVGSLVINIIFKNDIKMIYSIEAIITLTCALYIYFNQT